MRLRSSSLAARRRRREALTSASRVRTSLGSRAYPTAPCVRHGELLGGWCGAHGLAVPRACGRCEVLACQVRAETQVPGCPLPISAQVSGPSSAASPVDYRRPPYPFTAEWNYHLPSDWARAAASSWLASNLPSLEVAACSSSQFGSRLRTVILELESRWPVLDHISEHVRVVVTVIVTKTPRDEPGVVRRVETAQCRRLRPAGVCATGRDGLGRRSACS